MIKIRRKWVIREICPKVHMTCRNKYWGFQYNSKYIFKPLWARKYDLRC